MAKKKEGEQQPIDEQTAKNLSVYERARLVPESAIKPIMSGRLKGKSDINPVYRIKRMTEIFGVVGFGWRYEIVKQWLEPHGNEVKAFTLINLYIKMDGEWSEAIPGIGGASFVSMEKSGPYVNDECYKMSLTDAMSVAMKSLGIAADIYYAKDGNNLNPGDSKYRDDGQASQATQSQGTQGIAFTGADLKQALADLAAAKTNDEYGAVWSKYSQQFPAMCVKGTEFYNACVKKANELQQS